MEPTTSHPTRGRRAAPAQRVMWLIWALAGVGLILSLVRGVCLREAAVEPLCAPGDAWHSGGFGPDGVYPGTDSTGLPRAVRRIGSWLGGDQWQGEAETVWVPVKGSISVYVSGYPQHPGCGLRAEFRNATGTISGVACPLVDPRETWQVWRLAPPRDAVELRLVAHDAAADNAGWFAFSEPIATQPTWFTAGFMGAQVFTTIALAFMLAWGPGLLWLPRGTAHELRTLFLLACGPLVLVLLGLVIWVGDGVVRPHHLAFVFTTAVWALLGWRLHRRPPEIEASTAAVLAISLLLVIATAAKATYSGGPEGELYGGTISRTLEVGDRSDARISFHVVQTAAHHFAPWHPTAEGYFSPWTFFSRGPLAGLAALPVALATSGPPPRSMPDQAWTPFDATGFAAYRIVLMTLASMVVFALFAVLVPFVGDTAAVGGAALLALCPFTVHEILFTWPKWEATSCVLAAFLLAHQRRPLLAGAAAGLGFLYHPLAGLWVPWLALWAAGRASPGLGRRIMAAAQLSVGVCLLAGMWMLAGRLAPHLPGSTDAGQLGFLAYFKMADYAPATWSWWWKSRGMNFANTFVPLWLYAQHADRVGSIYGDAGRAVKFAFSWWNTLPFGMGLLFWAASLAVLGRALRRHLVPMLVLVIGPALLLIAYWGAHATGLMRECGHPLLVAIVGLTVLGLERGRDRLARLVAHPAFPWLQLPETLVMLWFTTLLNPHDRGAAFRDLDPWYLCISVVALVAIAWIASRTRAQATMPAATGVRRAVS